MKRFLFLPLIFIFMGVADCSHSPGVKVWEFEAEEAAKPLKGWYRQDEVKTFGESDVKYGVNEKDMEYILNLIRTCKKVPPTVENKTLLQYLLSN